MHPARFRSACRDSVLWSRTVPFPSLAIPNNLPSSLPSHHDASGGRREFVWLCIWPGGIPNLGALFVFGCHFARHGQLHRDTLSIMVHFVLMA